MNKEDKELLGTLEERMSKERTYLVESVRGGKKIEFCVRDESQAGACLLDATVDNTALLFMPGEVVNRIRHNAQMVVGLATVDQRRHRFVCKRDGVLIADAWVRPVPKRIDPGKAPKIK